MLMRFERNRRRSDTPLSFFNLEADRGDQRLPVLPGCEAASVEISRHSPSRGSHAVEDQRCWDVRRSDLSGFGGVRL